MPLEVDVPEPPSLRGPQATEAYEAVDQVDEPVHDDYRRGELAAFLVDGAWARAFDEWASHTLLTESQYEVVLALGLLEELDFYWEPATNDVGFRAPSVPEELPASVGEQVDDGDVGDIEEALSELGLTVSEHLEAELGEDGGEFGFFAEEDSVEREE